MAKWSGVKRLVLAGFGAPDVEEQQVIAGDVAGSRRLAGCLESLQPVAPGRRAPDIRQRLEGGDVGALEYDDLLLGQVPEFALLRKHAHRHGGHRRPAQPVVFLDFLADVIEQEHMDLLRKCARAPHALGSLTRRTSARVDCFWRRLTTQN
jgi:hypothetical protein